MEKHYFGLCENESQKKPKRKATEGYSIVRQIEAFFEQEKLELDGYCRQDGGYSGFMQREPLRVKTVFHFTSLASACLRLECFLGYFADEYAKHA